MKIKLLTLLATIFLLTNISLGQSVGEYRVRKTETITKKIEKPKKPKVVREKNPEREGFYAKASVNIGAPMLIGSVGYEFNRHFATGISTGVVYNFDDLYFALGLEISGDITKRKIIGNATLCYSVEPIVALFEYWTIVPKIGLRNNNCHFYLGLAGFNFGYKIPFRK
jgi:hypothetical protein